MSYVDFTLSTLKKNFGLTLVETADRFAATPELPPSAWLVETLRFNLPLALAIATEKARSEMLIAPVLLELKRQLGDRVALFSGVDFLVDSALGLNGVCDYLLARSSEQLFISAPAVVLVEAKRDNLNAGLGQCAAEMLAAQRFNQREDNTVSKIYGAVTTGSLWKWMQLQDACLDIDLTEYSIQQTGLVLGVLSLAFRD